MAGLRSWLSRVAFGRKGSMAGKSTSILGAARLDTSTGSISIRSQNGMFDSAAWTRVGTGNYRCTLGGGSPPQNTLDQSTMVIQPAVESTGALAAITIRVNPVSNTVFEIYTSVGVGPIDPDIGFNVVISGWSPG